MQVYGEPIGQDDAIIVADLGVQGQVTLWINVPPVCLKIEGEEALDKLIAALQEIKADIPE